MWPITVVELGDGFVIGRERVVTKASGTFHGSNSSAAGRIFLYEDCLLVGSSPVGLQRATAEGGGAAELIAGKVWSTTTRSGVPEVAVQLAANQQCVIVW